MAILSPTNLETANYGTTGWNAIYSSNFQKLNTYLAYFQDLWSGLSSSDNNKIIAYDNSAGKWTKRTLQGTTNQINVTFTSSSITLSLPQDIATSSSPTFAGLTLTGKSGVLKAVNGVIQGNATTDDMPEGTNNLYFTTARARASITAQTPISYNKNTGVISFTGTTDDIPEGTNNLYFTQARVRNSLSAQAPIVYNNTTGVISFDATTTGIITRVDINDYGGNFTNYTPPDGAEGKIIVVIDTNSNNPAKRLYVYANGQWNYCNLT